MQFIYVFGNDENGNFTCLSRQGFKSNEELGREVAAQQSRGREVYQYDGPTGGSQGHFPLEPLADLANAMTRANWTQP